MRRSGISLVLLTLVFLGAGCLTNPATSPDIMDNTSPDLSYITPDASTPPVNNDMTILPPDGSGPPYPIILVHGMCGFRNVGPLEYFYGVEETLRNEGHDVWTSQQDPMNTSEVRGQQLQAYVQMVLEQTGKAKVNLIAHSQGGFDSQYVASVMGDHIASVTTIATPFGGVQIVDAALNLTPGLAQTVIAFFLNFYGRPGGYQSDIQAQLDLLSTAGVAAFMNRYPDNPQVTYYSIAGRSNKASTGKECATSAPVGFVARWNGYVDPINPALLVSAQAFKLVLPNVPNDGLVAVPQARHGRFLGCIPADHADEVGQVLGQSPGGGNAFDYLIFYRDLASWLVAKGH